MPHVLLLRAPTKDPPDKYERAFSEAGYTPISIPVLETVFTNEDALATTIKDGPGEIRGVIVTSARACEGWRNASEVATRAVGSTHATGSWSDVVFYVVGEATGSALREISGIRSEYLPKNIRGEASGTGEQLARYILADLGAGVKLLHLTGDKNRDTLPKILSSGGVNLVQLQVYETRGSLQFADNLTRALEAKDDGPWWIVFFAPSVADFVLPQLRKHFGIEGEGADDAPRRRAFVASIGPTTSEFLGSQLGVVVHATASKPTPRDLIAAMVV